MEAGAATGGLAAGVVSSRSGVAGGGSCRAASLHAHAQVSVNSRPSPSPPPPPRVSLLQASPHPLHSRRRLLGLIGALSFFSADVEHQGLAVPSCDFTEAPSGLGFCDTSPGSGLPASQGMLIKANYIGTLEDGKVFDSSYDRGRPLTFKIGVGQVIKGWDEGILGGEGVPPMLAGGKRRLRIPPQLGYGERGAGCRAGSCVIPPNSVLLFDVEFVGKAY